MPSLRSASRSVYFVPDRLLVLDHRTYADVPYEEGRWPGGARRG
ncbi:hypothetical protein ACFQV2_39685 [Actinokineospora soli]|uniref:Uncharacterized protein n=1 Tax=Actinokineospora soli TaxID=1048753 RepID=A0ABW2TYJ0_9PSEU